MPETKTYRLADETIVNLMQLLQLSLLAGKPLDDLMRLIELEEGVGGLVMTREYVTRTEDYAASLERELELAMSDTLGNVGVRN